MNELINIIYLILIFRFGALCAVDGVYKLDSKNDLECCVLSRNAKGRARIKLDWRFLTPNMMLLFISIFYGLVAMVMQTFIFEILNSIFRINLRTIFFDKETTKWGIAAAAYGWLGLSGFYASRASLSYFAAQQILRHINRSNPTYNPTYDLTIFKVFEENLRREESLLGKEKN